MRKGNYVLATKWSDGDPQDPWAIGSYDGLTGITENGKGRHLVVDNNSKQFRPGGFRRVKKIKPEVSAWLLAHKDQIEMSTFSMYGWERRARKELKKTMIEPQQENN